ncbi:hypothetical protein MtrunA17_Chr5g0414381 [Medicago truncatula]|uniref:Transmembrane protein n=1 Tax=Medicago truncatula TaxID=3880 RepID=A0A396HRK1_MEDTR|nr:hypothetical protein MtrunA17_Chr5g0414381 [Medicago truncatula]
MLEPTYFGSFILCMQVNMKGYSDPCKLLSHIIIISSLLFVFFFHKKESSYQLAELLEITKGSYKKGQKKFSKGFYN